MHIEIFNDYGSAPGQWGFRIVAANKVVLATSTRGYARKSNTLEAARLIAGKRMKVVVCE